MAMHVLLASYDVPTLRVSVLTSLIDIRAKNINTVTIARLVGGAFGSTGATMVGGTIADIWQPKQCVAYQPPFIRK